MATNNTVKNHTFHDAVTVIGTGEDYKVESKATAMNIEFITTGTFTAKIKAQLINPTKWYPYPCFKLPSYDLIETTITSGNFLYNVDLIGVSEIRVEITAISGTLTVLGKAVE